jgi:pyruvate kinase
LVSRARLANKPVIVATQMLESMIEQSRPTRAEVADVSHAVASGADAVMLSGETAVGAHPVAVVQMMDRIARHTESNLWYNDNFGTFGMEKVSRDGLSVTDALAISTAQLSRDLQISCIMVISETGTSAAAVSSARPAAPVVVITPIEMTFRKMSLFWGVLPMLVGADDLKNKVKQARLWSRELGLAKSGDRILLVRWFHPDPEKTTPSVTLLNV